MLASDEDWTWVMMWGGKPFWIAGGGHVIHALKWAMDENCSLAKKYPDGEIHLFWTNPWEPTDDR